ncbi:hypothetical protein ANCDUO_20505 [Ancylostoma duodenale]|uniref:NIDO domain-containing protein n=1 Tax=Ancylostoma duodenale TaxID=51022 RepID=A0A0C2FLE4_9BILA|nr:hypothetical protein ANCDUO_20505 [Ancylostoma duodenale]
MWCREGIRGQLYGWISKIHSSGVVTFTPNAPSPAALPVAEPVLAVYWMDTEGARVFYRETDDANIINLAHNEVNIQYRYGSKFRVKSVVIITWEGGRPRDSDADGNVFQLALIIGDSMTFAHIVYSKLNSNDNAVVRYLCPALKPFMDCVSQVGGLLNLGWILHVEHLVLTS